MSCFFIDVGYVQKMKIKVTKYFEINHLPSRHPPSGCPPCSPAAPIHRTVPGSKDRAPVRLREASYSLCAPSWQFAQRSRIRYEDLMQLQASGSFRGAGE